jgi:NADH:ubiquinone oxidoreductase subunit 2 (subunit N)
VGVRVALAITVSMTLVIGIYPQPFISMAREAIRPFFM